MSESFFVLILGFVERACSFRSRGWRWWSACDLLVGRGIYAVAYYDYGGL